MSSFVSVENDELSFSLPKMGPEVPCPEEVSLHTPFPTGVVIFNTKHGVCHLFKIHLTPVVRRWISMT